MWLLKYIWNVLFTSYFLSKLEHQFLYILEEAPWSKQGLGEFRAPCLFRYLYRFSFLLQRQMLYFTHDFREVI